VIPFVLRNAARELRSQGWRLLLISLCIASGFAAFFATYGFSSRVTEGVAGESRAMLGADLVVSGHGQMPPEALAATAALKEATAQCRVDDFPTMASTGPEADTASRLVEIRSVEGPYPLAGRLTGEPPLQPGEPWGALVDAGLAQAWGLRPGQPGTPGADLLRERRGLRLGDLVVPIQAVITGDDTRQATAFAMGPRVYVGAATVKGTGLITPRSRFSSRILLKLAPGVAPGPVAGTLRKALPARLRVQTHEEAATSLAEPIRNLNLFIRQLGLFTLLLSCLGAWAILAAYLKGRERDAAILRCLGTPPGTPAAIFGVIAALLVALALLLGFGAGSAAARALPGLLGDLIPQAIRRGPAPRLPLRETGAALLMLGLVLLPTLARLRNVSPLNLLRDTPGSGGGRILAWACGLGAGSLACALVVLNAPDRRVGFTMAAAMALLFGILFGLFRLTLVVYRHTAPRLPLPLKLALGQMGARPALGSLLMAVIGLAVFIVLSTQFVKDDLVRPLARSKGDGTRANLFFLDLQPGQVAPMQALVRSRTGFEPMTSPVVRARLVSIAGRSAEDGQGEEHSLRRREQNLTWRARLWSSEQVTRGRFWPEAGGRREEISLEEGFARQIGAKLGDELVFDAQGTEVRGRVTSLRRVAWQSFQLNFFIVLHPSLLQDLPAFWLMAAEAGGPQSRSTLQNEVARTFPAVTTLDVGDLVERVGRVLDLVALVTRALAALMLVSALLVLAASLLAGHLERQRDLALLRTLGARHATLLASLAWEFLLLGGGAALTAGSLAWYLARAFSRGVLKLEGSPDPRSAFLLVLLAAALTAVVGLAGSYRALQAKPMDVLRGS
jgi:putative ABC transport system permease protein